MNLVWADGSCARGIWKGERRDVAWRSASAENICNETDGVGSRDHWFSSQINVPNHMARF